MASNNGSNDIYDVIRAINIRLGRARQQEQYFLELEDEEQEEADKHDRLVQKYKSIRDLKRAAAERVARHQHRMEAQFYADKAYHYTAKIQKLNARKFAIYERAEEERRAQFEVLLQNLRNSVNSESRAGTEVVTEELVGSVENPTQCDPPVQRLEDLDLNGEDEVTVGSVDQNQITNSFKETEGFDSLSSVGGDKAPTETVLEDGKDGLVISLHKLVRRQIVLKGKIYLKYIFQWSGREALIRPVARKSLIYSKYLFKWDGVFQTEHMGAVQAWVKRNCGVRHLFTEGVRTRGRVLLKERRMM